MIIALQFFLILFYIERGVFIKQKEQTEQSKTMKKALLLLMFSAIDKIRKTESERGL